jgi:membrane protease YdiL (CAAX protease family)
VLSSPRTRCLAITSSHLPSRGGGFLLVGGAGLLAGTGWQSDPTFMYAVMAMLAGPPVAGVLSTGLTEGRAGLRDLLSRVLRWRVGARWNAAALLPAPVLGSTLLLVLSLSSPVYLPSIVTTGDRASLVVAGLMVGLLGAFVEELGWTGFAIPRLRLQHSLLSSALIVGLLWGAWHLLQMLWVGRTSSEDLPLGVFMPQYLFTAVTALTAYRVLMVWVYDRTSSLLLALLMHASYIATTLFILAPPTTGVFFLIYAWLWAAVLWLFAAVVLISPGGRRTTRLA